MIFIYLINFFLYSLGDVMLSRLAICRRGRTYRFSKRSGEGATTTVRAAAVCVQLLSPDTAMCAIV